MFSIPQVGAKVQDPTHTEIAAKFSYSADTKEVANSIATFLGPEHYDTFQKTFCRMISQEIEKLQKKSKKAARRLENAAKGLPIDD